MRPITDINVRHSRSFNPRICKRCDLRIAAVRVATVVSIHASVKDATYADDVPHSDKNVSIHASVKDATAAVGANYLQPGFNPRICKRCDSSQTPITRGLICFNPRICKRCDPGAGGRAVHGMVSIHASVKDATPCL